jgi:hypothetical protein
VESCDATPHVRYLSDGLCAAITSRIRRERDFEPLAPFMQARAAGKPGLLDAVRAGDAEATTRILAKGADPGEERGEHGRNALRLACAAGHFEIVKILLLSGADIHGKDSRGTAALHFAAWENRLDLVDLLLDWGIFPEETEGKGWTALHDAVRKEYPDIALRILAKARGLGGESDLREEFESLHGEDRFLRLLEILAEHYIVDLGAIGICSHGLLHDAKIRGYSRAVDFLLGEGVADEP